MTGVFVPTVEEIWRRVLAPDGASLMTPLGLIGGEVLTYLEERGASPLRRVIRELEWSAPLVTMATGALIRQGLVRATQHDLEVILEARAAVKPRLLWEEHVPEVWGG